MKMAPCAVLLQVFPLVAVVSCYSSSFSSGSSLVSATPSHFHALSTSDIVAIAVGVFAVIVVVTCLVCAARSLARTNEMEFTSFSTVNVPSTNTNKIQQAPLLSCDLRDSNSCGSFVSFHD